MNLKSNFKEDLQKEQRLQILLDCYYKTYLQNYSFQRESDLKKQLKGIDLVLTQRNTNISYNVDEKAQLDYINDDLPTFAFEINYFKNDKIRMGWLFDTKKETHFYSLVTAIYEDEPNKFTSCKITFVNRNKLLHFLSDKGIDQNTFYHSDLVHGKKIIPQLHHRKQGYLYLSSNNKAEKPLNLILKLDFLVEMGIAKRLT
ncbi:hypothetical protein [Euzebyella saccharophila]|uniref:Uncharacterized protein n=1 Tax=Euzebyella saccharophila TaxID=679664 RepID=A0ABV8JMJ1_9FLAO|nr:hypothetical protein [Euzebyella saccharophila]